MQMESLFKKYNIVCSNSNDKLTSNKEGDVYQVYQQLLLRIAVMSVVVVSRFATIVAVVVALLVLIVFVKLLVKYLAFLLFFL